MKTIKLLLIEDDVNLSYIMKSILEEIIGGYEVDVAVNGKEGLDRFNSFVPDVIVSDIEMPVMNGYEAVKKIRQTNSEIPIVLASGKVNPQSVTAGYEVGADNYIKKPYTPEELDAHIKSLINLKTGGKSCSKSKVYQIGKYVHNSKSLTLNFGESEKTLLTAKESQILELLIQNKGKIVKREEIIKTFWNEKVDNFFASRSLDVFITKLRKYLSKDTSITIRNVKPVGLILEVG